MICPKKAEAGRRTAFNTTSAAARPWLHAQVLVVRIRIQMWMTCRHMTTPTATVLSLGKRPRYQVSTHPLDFGSTCSAPMGTYMACYGTSDVNMLSLCSLLAVSALPAGVVTARQAHQQAVDHARQQATDTAQLTTQLQLDRQARAHRAALAAAQAAAAQAATQAATQAAASSAATAGQEVQWRRWRRQWRRLHRRHVQEESDWLRDRQTLQVRMTMMMPCSTPVDVM